MSDLGARRAARAFGSVALPVVAFFFPLRCLICGGGLPPAHPVPLCAACRRRMTPVTGPTCLVCRADGRGPRGFAAGRDCRHPAHEGYFVHAAVQMIDPADGLVHALKFRDRPDAAAALALFLRRRFRRAGVPPFDLVVPLPLHAVRERTRGYNQCAEIARRLGPWRGSAPARQPPPLVRRRATRAQADLDYAARALNVGGAFALGDAAAVRGRRCLVLDDVATTGHTLVEAIETLRRAEPGATAAAVFALA